MSIIMSFLSTSFFRATLCLSLVGALTLLSVPSYAGDWRYSVRPGDTFWSICREYTEHDNCWRELASHNGVANPNQLSIGTQLLIPMEWLKQAPFAAQAVYIMGEVVFSDANKKATELVSGQALNIGSKVVVSQGSATLRFADGATILMNANSELIIDSSSAIKQGRAQSIEVSLPRGQVKVTVPERMPRTQFRVKTPSAVAAVRGTKFRVSSTVPAVDGQSGFTRSEVLEGTVEVSTNSDNQKVTAGHGVSTVEGQELLAHVTLISAPRWNRDCTDPGYVEWQTSLLATQYRLALMEDDTRVDKVISSVTITDANYTFKKLKKGCYQVKVNAVDSQGYNGLESQRRLCYQPQLGVPQITEAKFNRAGLLIVGDELENANSYRIEVSQYADFSSLVASETVDKLNVSLPVTADVKSIYVRAQAFGDDVPDSAYSEAIYLERKDYKNTFIGIVAIVLAFVAL